MSFRPCPALPAIVLGVALLGLSACNSQPGHRRVALDMIESLNLPTAQEQCMKDVIGGYTNDDLENIASDNDGLAFNTEDYIAAGTPEFQEYVERLQACREGDRDGRATEQGGPTTPGAGEATDATDAADAAEATEAVNDTTPAAETTAD